MEDVNIDLHRRVAAAFAKGHFASHNIRESDLDGYQDLTFQIRRFLGMTEWHAISISVLK